MSERESMGSLLSIDERRMIVRELGSRNNERKRVNGKREGVSNSMGTTDGQNAATTYYGTRDLAARHESLSRIAGEIPGGVIIFQVDSRKIIYANDWIVDFYDCEDLDEFYQFSREGVDSLLYNDDRQRVPMLEEVARASKHNSFRHPQYQVKTRCGAVKTLGDYGKIVQDAVYGEMVILCLGEPDTDMMIEPGLDHVTGLSDVGSFLHGANEKVCAGDAVYYVVYFNILSFKLYNIKYGNENGDWVLRLLSQMLLQQFGEELVARYSEDHFVVLTCLEREELVARVQMICDDFLLTYANEGLDIKAGICRCDTQLVSVTRDCDLAKIAGDSIRSELKTHWCFYSKKMEEQIEIYDYVIHELDRAIENGYIRPYFQPVIRTLTGGLCSFEALARWEDPQQGFLMPADFIGALESSHQIYKLDLYIVREVCRRMRERMDAGKIVVPVSFNISRMDLLTCDVFAEVEKALDLYQIPREMIHVEMTESIMLGDTKIVLNTMRQFQDAGYQVWMDDFGSGYSSLNLLSDCGFDEIKLDMGFLARYSEKSKIIIENIVRMAKQLGIQTLAEGVETREQYEFLKKIGCEKVQGFYFDRPLPTDDAARYVDEIAIRPESQGFGRYYDKVGKVELVTDRSLALVEYKEDQFEYLYANERYLDILYQAGRRNLEDVQYHLNDLSTESAVMFRDFASQMEDSDQFAELYYQIGEHSIRLRARRIAKHKGQCVYETELANITQRN